MKGRIFKFVLHESTINYDMDNFLFNIVPCRENNQIYLTKGRVRNESIDEDDYIFIQSENKITHYMRCNERGPIINGNKIEISVKDIVKFHTPKESRYYGEGFNILSDRQVKALL